MVKKTTIAGVGLSLVSAVSWFGRGTLENWFFGEVLKKIEPYPNWSVVIEYGPPAILSVLAVWLIWRGTHNREVADVGSATGRAELPTARGDGPQRFVPLPDATRQAYEQLRKVGSIWAGAADQLAYKGSGETREEATLLYLASAFHTLKVPMWGMHPPSRVRELIDPKEFRRGSFANSGATLHYHMNEDPIYVDIAVLSSDLDAVIERMKGDSRRQELQAEAEFTRGFDSKSHEAKQAALLLLTHLREEGVQMRNDLPTFMTTSDLQAWVQTVSDWMNTVIEALQPISAADAKWFGTLDTVPPARVPIPNIRLGGKDERQLYESIFRQHDYRLKRLEDLLTKYGVGARN